MEFMLMDGGLVGQRKGKRAFAPSGELGINGLDAKVQAIDGEIFWQRNQFVKPFHCPWSLNGRQNE